MTRSRKIHLSIAGVVALLVAAGIVWFKTDEEPPDDSDLLLVRRAVSPEDNGFLDVDLKREDFQYEKEIASTYTPCHEGWDREMAARAIEKNAALLERIDRALARPEFQIPPENVDSPCPYLRAWRSLTHIEAARAILLFEEGKEREAWVVALKLVRLGHRIQSGQGVSVDYLVGSVIKAIGLTSLRCMAKDLPASELRDLSREIGLYVPDRKAWADMVRAEYRLSLEVIDLMYVPEGVIWNWTFRLLVRPNATRRILAEDFRKLFRDFSWQRENMDFDDPFPEIEPRDDLRNLAGRVIRNELMKRRTKLFFTAYRNEIEYSATRLVFAIESYRRTRGAPPGSLDALVPDFIQAVPIDPCDGGPLRYSREKGIVWSIGQDREDAGGLEIEEGEESNRDDEEPTFRVAAAEGSSGTGERESGEEE